MTTRGAALLAGSGGSGGSGRCVTGIDRMGGIGDDAPVTLRGLSGRGRSVVGAGAGVVSSSSARKSEAIRRWWFGSKPNSIPI